MANTKNKESKAYKNKVSYINKRQKEKTVRVYITLNKSTEADMLDHINAQSRKATYIKNLIRRDMNNN